MANVTKAENAAFFMSIPCSDSKIQRHVSQAPTEDKDFDMSLKNATVRFSSELVILTLKFPQSDPQEGLEQTANSDCNYIVKVSELRQLLRDKLDSKLELSVEAYIRRHRTTYAYCLTPGCQSIYGITPEPKQYQCPKCSMTMCTACTDPSHPDQSCEAAKQQHQPLSDEDKKKHGILNWTLRRTAGGKRNGNQWICNCGKLSDQYAVLIRSYHYRKELTNRIEHTARQAGSLHILNQPGFSIGELIQSLAAVKRQDQGVPALNIQALRGFSNQPQRRPEIRVGKTDDLIQCYDHHEVDRVNKQHEPFYEASREGTFYGMYVLQRALYADDARTFAEQMEMTVDDSSKTCLYGQEPFFPGIMPPGLILSLKCVPDARRAVSKTGL
ncbi:hypothetical protein LTS15_007608 [Exophiala xenobiotica]|nr:hypothetical protein LTS15_007608 [Exophiala xenobiotica]